MNTIWFLDSYGKVRSLQALYKDSTLEGKMDRLRFREIIHTTFDITDDVMLDRIFRAFDTNNDALVKLVVVVIPLYEIL